MLKWSITIGEKPRGMWRPGISLHLWDDEPENPLNIATRFDCAKVYTGGCARPFGTGCATITNGTCTLCPLGNGGRAVPQGFTKTDLKFYRSPSHQDGEALRGCDCPGTSKIYEAAGTVNLLDFTFEFYPEWRPGYPDYGDYVEFLHTTYCIPAMEEYDRRRIAAMASHATEEQVFSSNSAGFPHIREGVRAPLTRRIRVAG